MKDKVSSRPEPQLVPRKSEISMAEPLTLAVLQTMAQGKLNWQLEMDCYYDESTLCEVWESPETPEEVQARLALAEKQSQARKKAADKKREQELKEYNRLKKKFGS